MIESIQISPIALASNSSFITLSTDSIRTRSANCCNGWLQHREGSPLYQLLKCGYYDVYFKTLISSATAGSVAIGLYEDGIFDNSTLATSIITTAGDVETLSFHTTLQVCGNGNTTIAIGSAQAIPNFIDLTGASTVTQIPIIGNSTLILKKLP